jgi:hypothetical protein
MTSVPWENIEGWQERIWRDSWLKGFDVFSDGAVSAPEHNIKIFPGKLPGNIFIKKRKMSLTFSVNFI